MILTLAALLASPAPGCRSAGPSVHCVLAAPVAAVPVQARPKPPIVPEQAQRPPLRIARATLHAPAAHRSTPPDAAEITRHIASLVAIADCTGARTYATASADAALAERTFAACIGRPSPAGLPVGLPSGPMPADTEAQIPRPAAPAVSERPS